MGAFYYHKETVMLTNKHVVIALIVAPILAVIAYFATDAAVGEKPHKAQAGKSYATNKFGWDWPISSTVGSLLASSH